MLRLRTSSQTIANAMLAAVFRPTATLKKWTYLAKFSNLFTN